MTATRPRTVSFRVFAAAAALLVSVSSGVTYLVTRGSSAASSTTSTVAALPLQNNASPSSAATNATTNGTTNATNATTIAPTNSITLAETASVTASPSATATANANAASTSNDIEPARVAGRSSTAAATELTTGQRATTRYAARQANTAEVAYEREITSMRRIVDERLGDLDSVTVVEIERNLRIIDKAINDSRRALQNDPRSRFLSKQLDRALESKLDIMRRVALL